ncbi:hypothetical protein RE432_16300 [Pusillimonas sp. SM2304]|nr:hypothetical protein [Pusillimonas sp. SM2304]MDS1142005.1 hypothetical protein [Pusillimonas sp. SM2304]
MLIKTSSRCGMALFFAALVSGCSSVAPASSERPNACTWNRSSCMYEGKYEPGEEAYAEQEAKRLNRAAVSKLRRSAK